MSSTFEIEPPASILSSPPRTKPANTLPLKFFRNNEDLHCDGIPATGETMPVEVLNVKSPLSSVPIHILLSGP